MHDKMAPYNGRQSSTRLTFGEEVSAKAIDIANACADDISFRACFNNTEESEVRLKLLVSHCESVNNLRSGISKLEAILNRFHHECLNDPIFIVVFDEVSSLLSKDGRSGRYIALNRIISIISENHKVWYFLLSTESKIEQLLPPDSTTREKRGEPSPDRPSWRGNFQLQRFPPFTKYTVDIPDINNDLRFTPRQEYLEMFGAVGHMAKFGRPLWRAYNRPDELASIKLIGGNPNKTYNPDDRNHVFAALSVRLCLDLNLANPITLPLSRTAVNSHMRFLDSLDPSSGCMFTTTPTEPILAVASMRYLCANTNWARSLKTLVSELLDRGAIDKGRKGELFSRFILTIAHDNIADLSATSSTPSGAVIPAFTVDSFLKKLFSHDYHGALAQIDSDILQGRMNFLYFAQTQEFITAESLRYLCYVLLRRSAALQLAPNQKTYDQLLPFYCGDPRGPFDIAKVGAIFVQVKYRNETSSPSSILRETFFAVDQADIYSGTRGHGVRKNFQNVVIDDPNIKLLFILFDLGSEKTYVEVSRSKFRNPTIWAIDSKGNDQRVFECLNKRHVNEHTRSFFNSLTPVNENDQIQFNHHKDLLYDVLYFDKINLEPEVSPRPPTEDVVMTDLHAKRS